MLNILSSSSERIRINTIANRKMFFSMIDITCTPPIYRFIYLEVSRNNPFEIFTVEILKRLGKQLREDNNRATSHSLYNEIQKIYIFICGFKLSERNLAIFKYSKERYSVNPYSSQQSVPQSLSKKLMICSKRGLVKLKFAECCNQNKNSIMNLNISNRIELIN